MGKKIISISGTGASSDFKTELDKDLADRLFRQIEIICSTGDVAIITVEIANAYLIYKAIWRGGEKQLSDVEFNMVGFPSKAEYSTEKWHEFREINN